MLSKRSDRPKISENAFQAQFIDLARQLGWRVAHFRPSINRRGKWSTAVQGDGVGFPDNILVKGSRIIAAELKSEAGKLTPEQLIWLNVFRLTDAEVYVFKPSDYDNIVEILRHKPDNRTIPEMMMDAAAKRGQM
ncbi:MAG: VRR-NUC domain-containing protein [Dehalococcoidia bacterium]